MAKVLYGGRRKEQLSPVQEPQTQEDTSFSVPHTAASTASRVFESLGGLPGNILSLGLGATNYLTGGRTPTYEEFQEGRPLAPRTSAQIRSATKELSGGYTEPKNKVEAFIGDVGEDLPLYLISGGSFLPSLGRSVSSNAARTAAKEVGAGSLGQAAAGIAGGATFDVINNKRSLANLRPKNVKDIAKKKMTEEYSKASELSSELKQNAQGLITNVADDIDKLYGASGLPSRKEKEVIKQLERVLDSIRGDSINVKKAWDLKKHFNKLSRDELNSTAKNYYNSTAKNLNNIVQQSAKAHPEFGQAFNTAEDLYISLNGQSAIREILEKNSDLKKILENPVSKLSTLGGSYLLGGTKGAISSIPITVGLRQAARTWDFFKGRPAAKELFKDLAYSALDENKELFANTLRKFNQEAASFEQENPEVTDQPIGKVLKGGRKSIKAH